MYSVSVFFAAGRTPHGVRGLKYRNRGCGASRPQSHPSWGAWIEITSCRFPKTMNGRRTPHGVRGLKSVDEENLDELMKGRTPHGVRGLK